MDLLEERKHQWKGDFYLQGKVSFKGVLTARVDYDEIFTLLVKLRTLLSLVAQLNMELKQLDVKTSFLHIDLEETH